MEKIYRAHLQGLGGGLKRLRFKTFCNFLVGQGYSASIFCGLIRAALNYKYRSRAGTAIPLSHKDLAVSLVFEFKQSDRIPLTPTVAIDGKRLRELFVTMIYALYLDGLGEYDGFKVKGGRVFIGYPEQDRSVDSAIFITHNAPLVRDGDHLFRAVAGKSRCCATPGAALTSPSSLYLLMEEPRLGGSCLMAGAWSRA
jgi:hypothetical protein